MLLNRVRRLHGTIVSLRKHFLRVNDDDVYTDPDNETEVYAVRRVILKVFLLDLQTKHSNKSAGIICKKNERIQFL